MNIVDAIPPADYPAQVIVAQEPWFVAKHPEAAYWLRIGTNGRSARSVQLPGTVGPTHASRLAREIGIEPTHYTTPGDGLPWLF